MVNLFKYQISSLKESVFSLEKSLGDKRLECEAIEQQANQRSGELEAKLRDHEEQKLNLNKRLAELEVALAMLTEESEQRVAQFEEEVYFCALRLNHSPIISFHTVLFFFTRTLH